MAARDEHTRCALCKRTLLVGEAATAFQDPRSKSINAVCPLCLKRAAQLGWEPVGTEDERQPPRVEADGAIDATALAGRLQADIERLERQLDVSRGAVQSAEATARTQREREDQLVTELDQALARIRELEGGEQTLRARLDDAARRVTEAQQAQEQLLRARRREADVAYLCGIAAEAFNRSDDVQLVRVLTDEHGPPEVQVGVEGITLPRLVLIVFAWPGGCRRYRIRCDLVTRLFDVDDLSRSADLEPLRGALRANARFVDGRIELGA